MTFLIQQTMIYAVPLMIVALAGVFAERSGIINLALEGIMILGAFIGVLFVNIMQTNHVYDAAKAAGDWVALQGFELLAMLVAAIFGAIFSLLLSFASVNLRADQTIGGTALNLMAPALVLFLIRIVANQNTLQMATGDAASWFMIKKTTLGYAKTDDLGFLGNTFLHKVYLATYICIIIFVVLSILLYKTRFGLRLRSCGENPQAADSVGINVYKMRYAGTTISGALAGMGGFVYALTTANCTANGDVAGFGFLSLAVMIFGQWKPGRIALAALLFGREVNGAKAWFEFGSFRVQPVEFAKIATALALARVMSEYSFSINRVGDLFRVGMVICTPLLIIVLQNDTGSGIVLGSFLFVLYREGLNKWLCIPVLLIAALFIFSFLLSPMVLLVSLILVCTLSEAMMHGQWRSRIIYLASLGMGSILLCLVMGLIAPGTLDLYHSLLIVTLLSLVVVVIYAFRANLSHLFITLGLFVGSLVFLPTTDYIFNSILKEHQQNRILSFLGIINDPQGVDYNVNQSKIAIGSGGFWGKGFLEGTQIKYGFVPERHTDFIFCTVGEEWGFVGSVVVLTLLCMLILRLMRMGERQQEPFGRVYCYSVASILLFHVFVNVGMTVGLMPVMGIPLPFMSYGGSSLIAFTILLFIAVRLDASTRQFSLN